MRRTLELIFLWIRTPDRIPHPGDFNTINYNNMKKLALIACMALFAFTMSAAPTITSQSRIVLKAAGQGDKKLNFLIGPSWSDAKDSGYDSEDVNGGVYIVASFANCMRWASNQYSSNLKLGFKADNSNTSYTLSFENFSGDSYEIYDIEKDQTIIVNGSTPDYEFTIAASDRGKAINNRFLINYEFEPDEGELNICFNEKGTNTLEIKNNPYTGKIAIKNAAGEDVLRSPYQPLKTPQEIDLSSLPAGRYTVILTKDDEEKKLIIVK